MLLASSSALPVFQPFHKKKKHSMGMGCHCYEWIAVATQAASGEREHCLFVVL